ncbi:hypothetical protein BLNAU_16548 [Blattamonas nauphoetae]|uniref:Uncharacterized protein n=1 Tax=Blattamonas nauphoetae TaxID=2049346 RepID=A0ABQ9XAR6_9EUKA|nr:hypothetical protein BLNAU_16548 [Blattamonas nauphoetae]
MTFRRRKRAEQARRETKSLFHHNSQDWIDKEAVTHLSGAGLVSGEESKEQAILTRSKEVTNVNDINLLIKKANTESEDGHFDNSEFEQSAKKAMGNPDVGAYTSHSSHIPAIQGGILYFPNIGHLNK